MIMFLKGLDIYYQQVPDSIGLRRENWILLITRIIFEIVNSSMCMAIKLSICIG